MRLTAGWHRVARAALTAVSLTSLAACSGSGGTRLVPSTSDTSGAASSTSASVEDKGVAPDSDTPSATTSAPSSAPPTSATIRASTPASGLRDFSDLTFSVPSGFAISTAYSPITPLENDFVTHYVVPAKSTDTREVIGMAVYTLPSARTVSAATDQVARIKAYDKLAKAKVSSSGISTSTSSIDGVPAWTETASQTGDAGTVTYLAYWAFGTHHVLEFSCQLGSSSDAGELAVACGTTLASVRLT